MHAEKCPVCCGQGKLDKVEPYSSTTTVPMKEVCHGCHGAGWVCVPGDAYAGPGWMTPPPVWTNPDGSITSSISTTIGISPEACTAWN